MRKAIILMLAACLFMVFPAGAQDRNQPTNDAGRSGTYVNPDVQKSSQKRAPAHTKVTTSSSVQSTYTGNAAPTDASLGNTNTVVNKTATNSDIQITAGTPNSVPAKSDDFPIYRPTGDPVKDAETFRKAKEEWISKNPEKYLEMLNQSK